MTNTTPSFADVILPLALPKLFTYIVPAELQEHIQVGQRVIVSFGPGTRYYTAIVRTLHDRIPEYEAKAIEGLLDEHPIVASRQFEFWDWMSEYYLSTLGEVMNAALPGALKLGSETTFILKSGYRDRLHEHLSEREHLIIEALEVREMLRLGEVAEILGIKTVQPYLKSLIDQQFIDAVEEVRHKYRPKVEKYVTLSPRLGDENALKEVLDQLPKAPKQFETLMLFLQLNAEKGEEIPVRKIDLQKRAGTTANVLNELIKKDILTIEEREVGRIPSYQHKIDDFPKLSQEQITAFQSLQKESIDHDVVLFHGVTSSGKTEIYVKLIEEVLKKGKQVLYLIPEIALTTQLILRLQKYFGDQVGVYHSRFNENERVEVWNQVLAFPNAEPDKYQVILGARSAIFLPFQDLGLIIVDEEHEHTFKQMDPAPRYHARDAATVLAKIHQAQVILGSATPAIESFWNAQQGKYGYVSLNKRYGGIMMPEILRADIAEELRKKKMKSHFSSLLISLMAEALENKEQVILFQNRRGYAPVLICETCGHVPQCKNCDVSLTYHKFLKNLNCHYCNYAIPVPQSCPACGSGKIHLKGFGTEKIEEELSIYFPEAKVGRLDLDSTRSKNAYERILSSFENREIDVLVGTQMITKGLDFDHVSVVGILNADAMLKFPDFRAYERSYQIMLQVAGRAGRTSKRGKVVIQAYDPNHPVIQNVMDYDYESRYQSELLERRNFHYPPFYRLISFNLRHRDIHALNDAVKEFDDLIRKPFGNRVLGPQTPPVARIRNYYHRNFLLKIERESSVKRAKKLITEIVQRFQALPDHRSVRIRIDVDPY